MTIAPLLCILLYFLFPCSISAGPRSTVLLSPLLKEALPPCARNCLSTFIDNNFPTTTCRDPQNLRCLCTKKSQTGYTLGEAALTCVASACAKTVFPSNRGVYGVCLQFNDAQPMTHKTLTTGQVLTSLSTNTRPTPPPKQNSKTMTSETPGSPSEIPFPSADTTQDPETSITSDSGSINSATDTTTDLDPTTVSEPTAVSDPAFSKVTTSSTDLSSTSSLEFPTSTTLPVATSASPTLFSSSSASFSSSTNTSTPAPAHALSKGQVAGVAVAGVASAALAFGLLFFFLCIRQRKRNRRDSDASFGNDKEINAEEGPLRSPSHMAHGHGWAAPPNSIEQTHLQQQYLPPTGRKSDRFSRLFRPGIPPEDIGVALAADPKTPLMHDAEPPMTAATYRTTSQLLPEAPMSGPYTHNRGIDHEVSPISPIEQTVGFGRTAGFGLSELHGTSFRKPSAAPSELDATPREPQTGFVPIRMSTSDPVLIARRNRDSTFFPGQGQDRNSQAWTRSTETLRRPDPARVPAMNHFLTRSSSPQSQGSRQSLHPGGAAGAAMPTSALASLPSQRRATPARAPHRPSRASLISRKPSVSRRLTDSDTEFDDTGSDNEAPPLPISPRSPALPSISGTPRIVTNPANGGQHRFANAAAALQNSQVPSHPSHPQPSPRRMLHQYVPPIITSSTAPSSRVFGNTTTITAGPPGAPFAPPPTVRAINPPRAVAELPGSAVSDARRETVILSTTPTTIESMSPRSTRDIRQSARWQLLVGSGQAGIQGSPVARNDSVVRGRGG